MGNQANGSATIGPPTPTGPENGDIMMPPPFGSGQQEQGDDNNKCGGEGDWAVQQTKKAKRRAARNRNNEEEKRKATGQKRTTGRTKPAAVLVMPMEGRSYSEVLAKMTQAVDVDQLGVTVRAIRETKKGGVLVELGKTELTDRVRFERAVTEAVGDEASVRSLIPQLTVEVRGITPSSTVAEVEAAVRKSLGEKAPNSMEVWLSPTLLRGSRLAKLRMEESTARTLAGLGHIRIGWVSCSVRIKESPVRCYKCLGFGHSAANCRGPDRSKLCWRCGGGEHKARDCKNAPHCFLCRSSEPQKDASHVPGGSRCASYAAAAGRGKT